MLKNNGTHLQIIETYGQSPLYFEINHGKPTINLIPAILGNYIPPLTL